MQDKAVLVFAPQPETFEDLCRLVDSQAWVEVDRTDRCCDWIGQDLRLELHVAHTVDEAKQRVRGHYYHGILVDCRHLPNGNGSAEAQERALYDLLDALEREKDRERRYPAVRIAVLVGDEDEERVDNLIFAMGQRHVGACIRDLSLSPRIIGDHRAEARASLVAQVWSFCAKGIAGSEKGKKSLQCAGGGITGLYYELGVLKCIHDAFKNYDVRDFDMYFGISAGAMVASFMANGFHIDNLIANLGDINPDWPHKLRVSWKHLNVGEVPRRLGLAQKNLLGYVADLVRGRDDFSIATLFGNYSTVIGPMFDNAELESVLRTQFEQPGFTNDFRQLGCELYVGATDQDRRQHVLFGDGGYDDVPISLAIQASTAVNPFFPSVRIHGRYYTDGAVTRTSNLKAAIRKGANLVFIIDPFLPMISDEPGFNQKQGNLWIVQQDFKTVAFTRFEQVSEEVLRQNPTVSCYTFLPSNRMRELMTQSPVAATNFHPIVTEAYRSTYRRLTQLEYKIAGELAAHGIELDLRPVADKVVRLKRSKKSDARALLG